MNVRLAGTRYAYSAGPGGVVAAQGLHEMELESRICFRVVDGKAEDSPPYPPSTLSTSGSSRTVLVGVRWLQNRRIVAGAEERKGEGASKGQFNFLL